jgi:hypothetical protein
MSQKQFCDNCDTCIPAATELWILHLERRVVGSTDSSRSTSTELCRRCVDKIHGKLEEW